MRDLLFFSRLRTAALFAAGFLAGIHPSRTLACQKSLKSNLPAHVFFSATAAEFSRALSLKANPLFLKARSQMQLQEIVSSGGELFLNVAHDVGFGLTVDRELISLFNASGTSGWGAAAVKVAIGRGLKFLHCLEPLREYYESLGFVVAERYSPAETDAARAALWKAIDQPLPPRLLMVLKKP